MSTGTAHPAARAPIMRIVDTFELEGRPFIMLEIVGDVLALFLTWQGLHSPTDTLYIIDWKAGNITMVCPFITLRTYAGT
jgi:hypothetical protein